MNKEFIPYEQALALKKLGFDEPCILLYRGLDAQPVCQMGYEFKTEKNSDYNDETNYWLTVPTFSEAFRWFREKYKLHQYIKQYYGENFFFHIEDMVWHRRFDEYTVEMLRTFNESSTQEEAEVECLKKLIEIVKK